MNNKNEIQKEMANLRQMANLGQQIDNLMKRREVLQSGHKKLLADIKVKHESTTLAPNKAKLDSFTEAIKQVDGCLSDLFRQHTSSFLNWLRMK